MSGPPGRTVHNERTKLTATLLNGVAIASVAAGVVTPLAALTFGFGAGPNREPLLTTAFTAAWLIVGTALHYAARAVLGLLRE